MENKKSINTKEKMLKSCKTLNKAIAGFMWTLAGAVITYVIIALIFTLGLLVFPSNEQKVEFGDKFLEITNDMGENVNNAIEKIDEFYNAKRNNQLFQVVSGILGWSILFSIEKILKNTVENETPFTQENIKNMKKISIYSAIIWILRTTSFFNVGIIYILAIWIMSYIFNYGYQLQLEADETL